MEKKPALKKTAKVVVIEDDKEERARIKALLVGEGYDPACFEGGKQAINYFQTRPWAWSPSLVVTDLVMEGGGYALMRRVQELYPDKDVHFMVVTQLTTQEDKMEAELAGANYFLKKPFTDEQFIEGLKMAIAPKKSQSVPVSN